MVIRPGKRGLTPDANYPVGRVVVAVEEFQRRDRLLVPTGWEQRGQYLQPATNLDFR